MSFLAQDPNDPRPDWSEAFAYFHSMSVERAPLTHPAIDAVVQSFRATHANGGAHFARWQLPDHRIVRYFAAHHGLDVGFFSGLLRSATIRADLPMLKIPERFESPPTFRVTSSLSFEGDLANAIHVGGAYTTDAVSAREAKRLSSGFCAALFGDRLDEIGLYSSYDAWTPWFFNVAWDASWFGVDLRDRTCWLLCKTDTD